MRNQPCSCGSGKKYKHCCGKNVISMQALIDQEVVHHMHEFISYAAFAHEAFLYRTIRSYIRETEDEDMLVMFRFFTSIWALFFEKNDDGKTIFDDYVRHIRRQTIRPAVRSIIESWKGAYPTFMTVDDVDGTVVVGTDLLTEEKKRVKLLDMPDAFAIEKGQVLTGIFVPHGQYVVPFATFLPFPRIFADALVDDVAKQWERCAYDMDKWIERYPETFQQSLLITMIDTEQLSPKQREVLTIFERKANIDDISIIDVVRLLWRQYCNIKNPTIRKPEVYAAALHYIILDSFLHDEWMSQKQLASLYGISPNTLSKRIEDLYMTVGDLAFQLEMDEQLDELVEALGLDTDWDDEPSFDVCEDCEEDE